MAKRWASSCQRMAAMMLAVVKNAAECPQVDASGSGVAAAAFRGGGGERPGDDGGQAAGNVYGEGMAKTGPASGIGSPRTILGILAGIGIVAALMGVAGGEPLIPTIVLL